MTIEFMRSVGGFGSDDATCRHCTRNKATIAYSFPDGPGYIHLCTYCTQELALGMLRDVVAVSHGEAVAKERYQQMLRTYSRAPGQ